MTRCLGILCAALLALATGLALADEPPVGDGPPLKLKRKKRNNPPAVEPKDKDDLKKEDKVPPDKEPMPPEKEQKLKKKKKDKGDEPIVPEDGPGDAGEEDKEVLDRIGKNMRAVEDKLGNAELTEGTRQVQADILKDLDALIHRAQNPPKGGGGGADQPPPQGGAQKQKQGGGGGMTNSRKQGGGKQTASKRRPGGGRQTADRRGGNQPKGGTNEGPVNQGGMGVGSKARDRDPDLTNHLGEWGKIQESLRASATTFADPKNVPARYQDALRQYYRTLSETGTRKGE